MAIKRELTSEEKRYFAKLSITHPLLALRWAKAKKKQPVSDGRIHRIEQAFISR